MGGKQLTFNVGMGEKRRRDEPKELSITIGSSESEHCRGPRLKRTMGRGVLNLEEGLGNFDGIAVEVADAAEAGANTMMQ